MGGLRGNIVLIGYRAVGKSTVGRLLAKELAMGFLDTDEEIERRLGRPISEIVGEGGWEEFRRLEEEVIEEVSGKSGLVLATGGGVVLKEGNVRKLKESGILVLLWVEPEEIVRRLSQDPCCERRPPLKGNLLEEVREVLEERKGRYFEAADIVVDCTQKGPQDVVREIIGLLGGRGWGTPSGCSFG